jgi:hypothetical protein
MLKSVATDAFPGIDEFLMPGGTFPMNTILFILG